MNNPNKSYRIRTDVGSNAPNVIHVPFNQTYDMFEILSLKLGQVNSYKSFDSDYGVLVGRIIANGGFGIPNAKVSVFISAETYASFQENLLYNFRSVFQQGNNGVRYNLLPESLDQECHQNIGTFPSKTKMLDDNTTLETFDKYWKYTTTTNSAGDYMLFGIPTGTQQVHVDIDLSDCGVLSQRPHDMIGKGYNLNMFESPNQFKKSKDIDSLAQVVTQNKSVYVYPYWGDISESQDKFSLTRCDIDVDYKFESFAVFMGSIMTDRQGSALGKNCTANVDMGKMSDLTTGEGTIEMIRKTIDGKVEEFQIDGNRLIDGDGVWCYPIPMNLDYVKTDEFGTMVPTDNPNKGIATRAKVRFRISLDEDSGDSSPMKRAKYLVPNNPRVGDNTFFDETHEPDFEFGSLTKEESYRDILWNNVYSVKSYIPKLQKSTSGSRKKHTGIKLVNHYGDNNPMPYNALKIKLGLIYIFMCVLTKTIVLLVGVVNFIISIIGMIVGSIQNFFKALAKILGYISKKLGNAVNKVVELLDKAIIPCIPLGSDFCDDGVNPIVYYPGCGIGDNEWIPINAAWGKTKRKLEKEQRDLYPNPDDYNLNAKHPSNKTLELNNCIENQIAQANDAISFDFVNDWINGALYAPLWFRKITPKRKFFFGLITIEPKDQWCSSDSFSYGLKVVKNCAIAYDNVETTYVNTFGQEIKVRNVSGSQCNGTCQGKSSSVYVNSGIIKPKKTFIGQTVYYYVPVEWSKELPKNDLVEKEGDGDVKLLFATDLILLGNLNECNTNGIPQFFRYLTSTTYNMPTDVLFSDWEFKQKINEDGTIDKKSSDTEAKVTSEAAGNDWGNPNEFGKEDGGLFYSIGCINQKVETKSCINLTRICEYGVSLDETKDVPNLEQIANDENAVTRLVTDGYISWDELYNSDQRSMFATMNMNSLKTIQNPINGLSEYDFSYLYIDNFDGSLRNIMEDGTKYYSNRINYKYNYKLEQLNKDYYLFRMGNKPYYYDSVFVYENAFNGLPIPPDKLEGLKEITERLTTNRFPRYENSFYFYFGLKNGKTALDKFNSKYFAECKSKDEVSDTIDIKTQPNSWCSNIRKAGSNEVDGDGYIALDCQTTSTPFKIMLYNNSIEDGNKNITISDIREPKLYISSSDVEDLSNKGYVHKKYNIENGFYRGTIEDSEGSMFDFTFNLFPRLLNFKSNSQAFTKTYEILFSELGSDAEISSNTNDLNKDNIRYVTRGIGGVISIYELFVGEQDVTFRVDVVNKKTPSDYTFSFVVNNGAIPSLSGNLLTAEKKNNLYSFAIGVNRGNVEYEVRITQLCNVDGNLVDTKNTSVNNIFVKEPKPSKLYVNGVDYDLLKKLDNNTGWQINNTIAKVNTRASFVNTGVTMSNPWFHLDNVFNNKMFYDIDEIHFKESGFVGIKDGNEISIDKQSLLNEFTKKDIANCVYTWVNEYVVDSTLDDADFAVAVNKALGLRKLMPQEVKDAFYITNNYHGGFVNAIVYTDEAPYKITIVYQPEDYDEDADKYKLTNGNLSTEETASIDEVHIPTITYDEKNDCVPIICSSNGIDKKPYSVGMVTYKGSTKPLNPKGNTNLSSIGDGFDKQLNYKKLLTSDLFNFPLIDMILKVQCVVWLPLNNIPKFQDGANHTFVSLDGIIAAKVTNGVITNNHYPVQMIDDKQVVLSDDYMDKSKTYVSQRVLCGYEASGLVEALKRKLTRLISLNFVNDVCDYLNTMFNLNGTIDIDNVRQVIGTLRIVDNNNVAITVVNNVSEEVSEVSLEELKQGLLPFTDYTTTNNQKVPSKTQYATITNKNELFKILDSNGYEEVIEIEQLGTVIVVKAENKCSQTKQTIQLGVTNMSGENTITYSVIAINEDGSGYPLNNAREGVVWHIDEKVDGDSIYSIGQPQNLFSIATTDEHLISPIGGVIDTSFVGVTIDETKKMSISLGSCTMGSFEFDNSSHKPFFIVASINNTRLLSPVYHFADVEVIINYGTYTENGSTKTGLSIGVEKNANNHYFNEYDYYIEGSIGNINIERGQVKPNEYLYKELTSDEYSTLEGDVDSAAKITTIIVTDCVGVRHHCKITKDIFVKSNA